jgi:CRISPR-associated exonuclease Cas4
LNENDDLIPISALQHILFCERQFALIHIEGIWSENVFTAEGKVLHERVHQEHHEARRLYRQEFGLHVRSLKYGLIGMCDLVELCLEPSGKIAEAFPVEFKRGKNKEEEEDKVQLCAQAMCLEEMFDIIIPEGQIYYLQDHRRTRIPLEQDLRKKVLQLADRARELIIQGQTPIAIFERKKCTTCSLLEQCMPASTGSQSKSVSRFIRAQLKAIESECDK